MKNVGPTDHSNDKPWNGMKKIVENYIIVKPKVERIGGQDDFEKLLNRKILEKYSGVKQLAARQKVADKRVEERAKRTFTDAGITIMTVYGEKNITIDRANELKQTWIADKKIRRANKTG